MILFSRAFFVQLGGIKTHDVNYLVCWFRQALDRKTLKDEDDDDDDDDDDWVVATQIFFLMFTLLWGKWSKLTSIFFQMGGSTTNSMISIIPKFQ